MRWCSSADFHGSANAITWAVSIAVVSAIVLFFTDGLGGILLLYLAVLPVALILFGLRLGHENDIPVALYTEMFLTGCVLSIGLATILEGLAQTQTLAIWQCERSPKFTWQCDALFIIVVTIAVGLSEEAAKFAPLSRIRRGARYLPESWWFRVAETPYAICLCGCAAAGGFACVENIKYTLRTGRENLEYGIDTSLFRAVLAIPFHVSCTGYAAALYAMKGYVIPQCSAESAQPKRWTTTRLLMSAWRGLRGGGATSGLTGVPAPSADSAMEDHTSLRYSLLSAGGADEEAQAAAAVATSDAGGADSAASMVYRPLGIWKILALLAVPAVCHGLYDSGLFLAAQFMTAGAAAEKKRASLVKTFKLEGHQYDMGISVATPPSAWRIGGVLANGAQLHLMTTNSYLLPHIEEILSFSAQNSTAAVAVNDNILSQTSFRQFTDPADMSKEAEREADLYYTLGFFSLAIALGSYVTILSLFLKRWRCLGYFQRRAVPMLHEHYDIPM